MTDKAVFTPEGLASISPAALADRGWAIERQLVEFSTKVEALEKMRALIEADVRRRGFKDYSDFLTRYVAGGNKTQYKRATTNKPSGDGS